MIIPLIVGLGKGILKVFLHLSHFLDFAFLSHYLIPTLFFLQWERRFILLELDCAIYCYTGRSVLTTCFKPSNGYTDSRTLGNVLNSLLFFNTLGNMTVIYLFGYSLGFKQDFKLSLSLRMQFNMQWPKVLEK